MTARVLALHCSDCAGWLQQHRPGRNGATAARSGSSDGRRRVEQKRRPAAVTMKTHDAPRFLQLYLYRTADRLSHKSAQGVGSSCLSELVWAFRRAQANTASVMLQGRKRCVNDDFVLSSYKLGRLRVHKGHGDARKQSA